jgi:predicted amidophosphoribosyltransferase
MRCTHCQHDRWKRALFCNMCGRALTFIRLKYGNLPRCGATFVAVVAHSGIGGWQPRPLFFTLQVQRLVGYTLAAGPRKSSPSAVKASRNGLEASWPS